MLEDTALEEVLGRADAWIGIPEDGPRRILDARDLSNPRWGAKRERAERLRQRTGMRWARRRPLVAAATAVVAVLVVATFASWARSSSHPTSAALHGSARSAALPQDQAPVGSVGESAGAGEATGAAAAGSPSTAAASTAAASTAPDLVPTAQPRVIKTGSVALLIGQGQLGGAMARLSDLAAGMGGFVASSDTNSSAAGAPASGDLTLRVPSPDFETLLGDAEDAGTATAVQTSGQDVTSQYVDLQARIGSLQDTRTQFQQILTKAQSIGDILAVEQQISDVQTQLEELQGQLQVMADQTTYATLSVHLTERGKKAATTSATKSGISKAWGHALHTFSAGVESILAASGGVAVFLLTVALLAGLARGGWALLRRRLV